MSEHCDPVVNTDLNLDAIEARASAAHVGPWTRTRGGEIWANVGQEGATIISDYCTRPDAEFIAHARQDVPALIARVRELEAVIREIALYAEPVEVEATQIALPACTEEEVASGLYTITRLLRETTGEGPQGLLGGENGYGVEYENDVFMMHPFCWCERPDCPWCLGCECEVEERGGDYVVVNECANCKNDTKTAPNFLYKPTGAEVTWYKYIGRGMEIQGELPLDFHIECIKSIRGEGA